MNKDFDMHDEINHEVEEPKPNRPLVPLSTHTDEMHSTPTESKTHSGESKINGDIIKELRSRWTSIQSQFVDQPCIAIEQADALVADALERKHQGFTQYHTSIRDRWYDHEDISTEELRLTLQEYRSFLNDILDEK